MKRIFISFITFFVFSLSFAQTFDWVKNLGGSNADGGSSISIDASGSVFTTGSFRGVADFDPGINVFNLISAGDSDAFISKLDSNGNFEWAKRIGGNYTDFSFSICTDSNGNVYIGGCFQGTVDFDPGTDIFNLASFGDWDSFILKLDPNGNFIWAKKFGGVESDRIWSMKLDSSDNIYATGWYKDIVDFDPGTGIEYLSSNGGYDFFILKLNTNGEYIWAKSIGDLNDDSSYEIAKDDLNNLYITGWFRNTVDFDPGVGIYNLTSTSAPDIFILKIDASGNFIWAKSVGGTGNDKGSSIIVDASYNVYISGTFYCAGDFDPGPGVFILSGSKGAFVLKLDANGDFIWAKSMHGGLITNATSIAFDISSNVYTTGYFNGEVDFDPGNSTYNLTASGEADIFLSKLDSDGSFGWAINLGGNSNDFGKSILIDDSKVFTMGNFEGIADFDPSTNSFNLSSNGEEDVYLLKLNISTASVENFLTNKIKVYPNPVDFSLEIDYPETTNFILSNLLGESIIESDDKTISFESLESGVYFAHIYDKDKKIISINKIIKK